jgi:hypothetical protein
MSQQEPNGPYVYQPHGTARKDGKLWNVGHMPDGMTREQARAIVAILRNEPETTTQARTCGTCWFAGPAQSGWNNPEWGRHCRSLEQAVPLTINGQPFSCAGHKPIVPPPPQGGEE